MVLSLYSSKEEQRIDASIVSRISQKNELRVKFFVEKEKRKREREISNSDYFGSEILFEFSILIFDGGKLGNISFVFSDNYFRDN